MNDIQPYSALLIAPTNTLQKVATDFDDWGEYIRTRDIAPVRQEISYEPIERMPAPIESSGLVWAVVVTAGLIGGCVAVMQVTGVTPFVALAGFCGVMMLRGRNCKQYNQAVPTQTQNTGQTVTIIHNYYFNEPCR